MPVEAKPLFRRDVLRPRLKEFPLPDRIETYREKMINWGEMIASSRIDGFKEEEILDDFVNDFFYGVLGYTRAVDSAHRFTIRREKYIQVDGKFADAVLGEFLQASNRFIAVVEGKGTHDPLERPFAGRRMSAVDQAYRYAINLPCDWIIVTSMRETRLYYKGAHQQTYERFETVRLAADEALLKRFVFLLGAERVVPAHRECHLYELLRASETVGRELTNQFYALYADIRQRVLSRLCRENATVAPPEILRAPRSCWTASCSAPSAKTAACCPPNPSSTPSSTATPTTRTPSGTTSAACSAPSTKQRRPEHPRLQRRPLRPRPGSGRPPGAGRGLRPFQGSGRLRLPPRPRGGRRRRDADGETPPSLVMTWTSSATSSSNPSPTSNACARRAWRAATEAARYTSQAYEPPPQQEGAVYTPAFITRYLVEQALGGVLKSRFETLRRQHEAEAAGTARKPWPIPTPTTWPPSTTRSASPHPLLGSLAGGTQAPPHSRPGLRQRRILIEAFNQLHAVYELSNARLEELRGQRTLFDLDRQILQHNLYGVDLNAEAIQICQLSLWIKTAARGKQLDQPRPHHPRGQQRHQRPGRHPKAFDWQAAFPEVFAQGGFDVVVGNPPYIAANC